MFWYHGVVVVNKVSEAGVKLLKCWKQLHLSNKDKYTLRERKKDTNKPKKKKNNLYQLKVYSLKLHTCLIKYKFIQLQIIKITLLLLLVVVVVVVVVEVVVVVTGQHKTGVKVYKVKLDA
jgi:hypothetical protein